MSLLDRAITMSADVAAALTLLAIVFGSGLWWYSESENYTGEPYTVIITAAR